MLMALCWGGGCILWQQFGLRTRHRLKSEVL